MEERINVRPRPDLRMQVVPCLARHAVKDMGAEVVAFGDGGVVEGVWVFGHADALHDGGRAGVADGREGDDLGEVQLLKADLKRCFRGFAGVAFSPGVKGESPANLYAGREGERDLGDFEADKADELPRRFDFYRPEPPALLGHFLFQSADPGIALCGREWCGKMFHHARVAIEGGKGSKIGVLPLAKLEARGFRLEHGFTELADRAEEAFENHHDNKQRDDSPGDCW